MGTKTFYEATQICQSKEYQADLITIHSYYKQDILK